MSLNVDADEISKFDDLASTWWDTEGEFKPLHQLNPIRIGFIQARVPNLTGLSVLDVGCGGGILSEGLAKLGASVTAIDMAPAALSVAKNHAQEQGLQIDYQKISVEELAAKQLASYDIITCMEMLEHVPNPSSVIDACATMLKPDGWFFGSTINRTAKAFMLAIVGAEYVMRMLPRGTHQYEKFIKPSEFNRMLMASDLDVQDLTGVGYNVINQVFRCQKDVSSNYLISAQKI